MELDDLRRQWQQPTDIPTPLELISLVGRRPANLIEQMRRNAWLEITLMALLTVATLIAFPSLPELHPLLYLVLLLMAGLGYYYYRLLGLLSQMADPAGSVRSHLAQLCAGLRTLLRFYYRLSVAMVPFTMLVLGVQVGQRLIHPERIDWARLGLSAGILIGVGGLVLLLQIPATRWYVQRLYGRHLDRLEGQLRELDEAAATPLL
jgi:hypothetical protein